MKKLLIVAIAFIMSIGCFAQTAPAKAAETKTAAKAKQVQNPAAYACPKCYTISKGAGKCEHCNVDKVQLGTYYCSHCMKSGGNKPGKCESCQMPMTQITRKYCAVHKMTMGDMKMDKEGKM